MTDRKLDSSDDIDLNRKDRGLAPGQGTEIEPQKQGAIKPITSTAADAVLPLPSEARPVGSPERMTAEALAAGERATPTPDRKQVSQSYWSLVWWKFRKNRLAIVGGVLITLFYVVCVLFPEFFAPYPAARESSYLEAPPHPAPLLRRRAQLPSAPLRLWLDQQNRPDHPHPHLYHRHDETVPHLFLRARRGL